VAVHETHEVQGSKGPVPAPTLPDSVYDELAAALIDAADRLTDASKSRRS
jgi:hypothetical protein